MREIELDLFSLTHPRVVADDDDDGRASILIVFLSFISPFIHFPPFFPLLHSFNPPQRQQLFFLSLFSLSSYAHILHLRPGGPQGATTQTRLLALHTPALRVFQGSLVV